MLFRKPKQKIIVITALYMSNYSGSVFVVSDFAKYFSEHGYTVYILTFHKKRKIVRSLFQDKNIHVINIRKIPWIPKIRASLVVGLHHRVFDRVMKSGRIIGDKFIYFSLSPYDNDERIPEYGNMFAKIYCNSWETAHVRGVENPGVKMNVFNNSVTPEFLKIYKKYHSKKIHKVAIVSNHNLFMPGSDFHKCAMNAGLEITFFGARSGNYKKIGPHDLLGFDAIVSIGRTVQYGLCLGVPVFCYDRFGGPGYITLDNWEQMEKMNYSGRMKPMTEQEVKSNLVQNLDCEKIVNSLIGDYSHVLKDVKQLREIALNRYDLYKNLDNMMHTICEK